MRRALAHVVWIGGHQISLPSSRLMGFHLVPDLDARLNTESVRLICVENAQRAGDTTGVSVAWIKCLV